MRTYATAICLGLLCTAMGCTSYYKVTDPTSGKVYYTSDMKEKQGGAITLKDARTGNEITLQTHEVDKINKEEFESGKAQPPAATGAASGAAMTVAPTPAPTATMTPAATAAPAQPATPAAPAAPAAAPTAAPAAADAGATAPK